MFNTYTQLNAVFTLNVQGKQIRNTLQLQLHKTYNNNTLKSVTNRRKIYDIAVIINITTYTKRFTNLLVIN